MMHMISRVFESWLQWWWHEKYDNLIIKAREVTSFAALYETHFVVKYVLLVCLFVQFSAGKLHERFSPSGSFSNETSK